MSTETYPGTLGDIRLAGASKGVSLSTTSAVVGFPESTHWYSATPRNFATAVVARVIKCPYLIVFKTTDSLATAANATDYTSAAQDADTATVVTLSSLDTAANGDYLYIGSSVPFRGVDIDVTTANGTASTLTVNYWNGSTWTDSSDTDGTASGGASLAVDGQVTWSVPSDWTRASLVTIGDTTNVAGVKWAGEELYWTRWQFSAALDADTTLAHVIGLNESTAYAELLSGQVLQETVQHDLHGYSGLEALTDAGTANLIVNVATRKSHSRFI